MASNAHESDEDVPPVDSPSLAPASSIIHENPIVALVATAIIGAIFAKLLFRRREHLTGDAPSDYEA